MVKCTLRVLLLRHRAQGSDPGVTQINAQRSPCSACLDRIDVIVKQAEVIY